MALVTDYDLSQPYHVLLKTQKHDFQAHVIDYGLSQVQQHSICATQAQKYPKRSFQKGTEASNYPTLSRSIRIRILRLTIPKNRVQQMFLLLFIQIYQMCAFRRGHVEKQHMTMIITIIQIYTKQGFCAYIPPFGAGIEDFVIMFQKYY